MRELTDDEEAIGQVIDRLDSLSHALNTPLPAQQHLDMLKPVLSELVNELKVAFVGLTGEDPWNITS